MIILGTPSKPATTIAPAAAGFTGFGTPQTASSG